MEFNFGNDAGSTSSGNSGWSISEKLQIDSMLTLEKAKQMICQRAVHVQQQVLRKDSLAPMIDEMKVTPTVISRKWKRGQTVFLHEMWSGTALSRKMPSKRYFVSQMSKKRTLCIKMSVKNYCSSIRGRIWE